MTIIGTFDEFKAVLSNFKKPTVVYHVGTSDITTAILEPGGTVFVVEPPPTEADFLVAVPEAIAVNQISG